MGEVVNLRRVRKRAARSAKEAEAEANRITFGLSSATKATLRREREQAAAALEGHRLERQSDPSEGDVD